MKKSKKQWHVSFTVTDEENSEIRKLAVLAGVCKTAAVKMVLKAYLPAMMTRFQLPVPSAGENSHV